MQLKCLQEGGGGWRGGIKSSTVPAGLIEASAIERNAVQENGFASSLHAQELFLTMRSLRMLVENVLL